MIRHGQLLRKQWRTCVDSAQRRRGPVDDERLHRAAHPIQTLMFIGSDALRASCTRQLVPWSRRTAEGRLVATGSGRPTSPTCLPGEQLVVRYVPASGSVATGTEHQ